MNKEFEKIAELGIIFRVTPCSENNLFELHIEANVIGTDNIVMDRRHIWLLGEIKRTKSGVFLSFTTTTKCDYRVRVYTEYRSKAARDSIRKVTDLISQTIAPKHIKEVRKLEVVVEMFEEIHRQLTVYTVLAT